MGDLFDLIGGLKLRDIGIEQVAENNRIWFEQAMALIGSPSFRREFVSFTGEDIVQEIKSRIGQPAHHNANGSLIMAAVKKGIMLKTGEYRPTKRKAAHGRYNPVYKWAC